MRYLVTGGAGFIGSTLVDRLLALGHDVTVFDNLSTGHERFIIDGRRSPNCTVVHGDVLDGKSLERAIAGADFVFHLAANADVRFGLEHPRRDLEQNTIGTFNVLDAMRNSGVRRIAFASTGSVYGEATIVPTPEDAPFPIQTSLYAASKLAGESLIQAYCQGFGFQAHIFRFVSILGERYSHGHVFDFCRSLSRDPATLRVLGDGHQRKSYLYVQDCIDAMLCAIENAREPVNVFNLGTDEYCEVNDSIGWITEHLGLRPALVYTGGDRGWIGDQPRFRYATDRLKSLGWQPSLKSDEAVLRAIGEIDVGRRA